MSVIDEVKARLDIVDVVSGYISLDKSGHNYKALCPFHSEKTPSFVVFPDSQSWRCFGACNEGGDLFSFVMKIEGLDFREALQAMAQRAGVELQQQTPAEKATEEANDRLRKMLDEAARLYMKLLLDSPQAEHARDYIIERRGLTRETIRRFQLGFAPDEWDFTLNHFRRQRYSREEVVAAGLAVRKDDSGRVYDRFRNRLMIPIRDGRGRTLGFGARALADDQTPKYLNSPQGPLFDKSKLLYGFDIARRAIRESETVVVTEGYLDVIQAHQAGYPNVVAQMGTALTEEQVRQLAKYAYRLVLALDTDEAGLKATMRGLDVVRESLAGGFDAGTMLRNAGKLELDVRVLRLPAGKDPDDFIRAAPDRWPDIVAEAQPLVDFVIEIGTHDLSPDASIQERERVARRLLPLLTATENDLYRHQNIQQLAVRLRIPEQSLLQWVSHQRRRDARPASRPLPGHQPPPAVPVKPGGASLERYCLATLLQQPDWLFEANRRLRELAATNELAARMLGGLGAQDFSREEHRVLFSFIESAAYSELAAPVSYVRQTAPPEIVALMEDIYPEGRPLEVFRHGGSPLHSTEIASIIREQQRFDDLGDQQFPAFLMATLQLRLERLKQERNQRYFSLETGEADVDHTHVLSYARAQVLLERAVHELKGRRQS